MLRTPSVVLAAALLLGCCVLSHAFYLPGVAPEDYQKGDEVVVKAEKLNSVRTQLPYEYYTLPFCEPAKQKRSDEVLNLGEIMHGSRIHSTPYAFKVLEDEYCKILCTSTYTPDQIEEFAAMTEDDYRVHMLLDNLPLAMTHYFEHEDGEEASKVYEIGYKLGHLVAAQGDEEESEDASVYLNNHLRFTVLYHEDPSFEGYRIVGFEVEPFSVLHRPVKEKEFEDEECDGVEAGKDGKCALKTCSKENPVDAGFEDSQLLLDTHKESPSEVIWTYDVLWKPSPIKWASRWDTYLQMQDEQVHWFSILNSFMIVLFLSGLVAIIMIRALKNDFRRYEQQLDLESSEEHEETGWKLVHGDVFRPPRYTALLSVYVGTGVQVSLMACVVMAFALLGFLSPANRGSLMSTALFLFVFMGIFGGYHASRMYKMFRGTSWKKMTLITALMFPGTVFAVFFVLNLAIWGQRSSGAVPFGTLIALLFMWFGISVPLVFLGSYFGFKKKAIEHPVRTNQIPRQVPPHTWYMTPALTILVGGVLPFGAVFVELFFILSSIWLHQFYYLFGFLFLVLVILVLTCAEITVVMCYFQLCSEDYHWWWRSYLTSGSCALYLFCYSVLYYTTRLEITKFVSGLLFFGYMAIFSYAFFVVTGTVGFLSCLWFVRKIYASVKVD
mmetsp:Transcript_21160/g.49622  ORF Transcript_21160/g.49622 Transcript_21160/m.49622 type:complete len:667 (-) Transcript_21160:66-2066(-)